MKLTKYSNHVEQCTIVCDCLLTACTVHCTLSLYQIVWGGVTMDCLGTFWGKPLLTYQGTTNSMTDVWETRSRLFVLKICISTSTLSTECIVELILLHLANSPSSASYHSLDFRLIGDVFRECFNFRLQMF